MDFFRIQDKMISREKIMAGVTSILELRARGLSQQEVADRLNIDRTFVSRLENLGEVRKGNSIGVIGFPILNKAEIEKLLAREGVDFIMLMTEEERTRFASEKTGAELLNELMDLIAQVRELDAVILLGSDFRLKLMRGLLDNEVLAIEIGESPLKEDIQVDPGEIMQALRVVKSARKTNHHQNRGKKS